MIRQEDIDNLRADVQELGARLVPLLEEQIALLRMLIDAVNAPQEQKENPILVHVPPQLARKPNEVPIDLTGEKE
jgi:hypothetical protein